MTARRTGFPAFSRRAFSRRTLLGGAAAGITGVLLTGCGDDGETTSGSGNGGGSGDLEQVTFLMVTPHSIGFAAELVADAGGHFADEGLQLNVENTRGSAQAIQTALAGTAPLTRIGDLEHMQAVASQDAPLVNVGLLVKPSVLKIVSHADNPLETAADFGGQMIGVPSEGGTSEQTLDLVVASGGFTEADVPRQVVGLTPGVFDLVRRGDIAGYFVSPDTALQIVRDNDDALIYSPSDDIFSGGQNYAISQQTLDDDTQRDVVTRYLRAIRAAIDSLVADTELDESVELMRSKYESQVETLQDTDLAKQALADTIASWQPDQYDNPLSTPDDRWNQVYEELVAAGIVPDGLDPSEWYTNELVEEG